MINTSLRIPEELYEQIVQLSLDEERSINNQIIFILRRYFETKDE